VSLTFSMNAAASAAAGAVGAEPTARDKWRALPLEERETSCGSCDRLIGPGEYIVCRGCSVYVCEGCVDDHNRRLSPPTIGECVTCFDEWYQVARLSTNRSGGGREEYSSSDSDSGSNSDSDSDSEKGLGRGHVAGDNSACRGGRRPRKPVRCASCTRIPEDGGWRCGGCKEVTYCGAGCQRRHWKRHRIVCGKLLRRY